MPTVRTVGGRIRYSTEQFDGGYDSKASPSKIKPNETPDALNVVFDIDGAVATRDGSKVFNTSIIGTAPIDMGISFNKTMVAWAGGQMYYASGTTFIPVTAASGKFASGAVIAAKVYQNILFCSDGTNGPWKWNGGQNFLNMGIVTPSACVATATSAGSVASGTYYYGVSFVNTQAVESQMGSAVTVSFTATSTVGLTSIPVGSALAGVNARRIYRSDNPSGPFRRIGQISDNVTTSFADTVTNGAEGIPSILDSNAPTPFTTIELHKERLFFNDASNLSVIRWTDFTNPFISSLQNFEPIDNGDGENIICVASQDDFVQIFKSNNNTSIETADPSDDTTWVKRRSPSNLGIVGPKAFTYYQNGIVFVGKQNNQLTGLHFLSGIQVVETTDGRLRSLSISQKIEYDLFNTLSTTAWSNTFLQTFQNRLFMAYTAKGQSTNQKIFWLDLTRVGSDGQPGSWAPWDGIHANCLFTNNGLLYAGDSDATGIVRQLNSGAYDDSGAAINSYFWTKEIGGSDDGELDSWKKDLREIYVWYGRLGNYNMNVRFRTDGDKGSGLAIPVNLNPSGSLWGSMVWGVDPWGGARTDFETRIPVGGTTGKRFQVRFDNQDTAGQGFKVYRLELGMNLRRPR